MPERLEVGIDTNNGVGYTVRSPSRKETIMDYRELLKKYMAYVLETEGVTFVDYLDVDAEDTEFTPAEVKALQDVAAEVSDEQ